MLKKFLYLISLTLKLQYAMMHIILLELTQKVFDHFYFNYMIFISLFTRVPGVLKEMGVFQGRKEMR